MVLNFDLVDQTSFLDMRDWINEVRSKGKGNKEIPMVLVGNKLDLCGGVEN